MLTMRSISPFFRAPALFLDAPPPIGWVQQLKPSSLESTLVNITHLLSSVSRLSQCRFIISVQIHHDQIRVLKKFGPRDAAVEFCPATGINP